MSDSQAKLSSGFLCSLVRNRKSRRLKMTSYLASVPKLKGRENYEEWAFSVTHFLNLEGLRKYTVIDVDQLDPVSVGEDEKTLSKLIMTLDTSLFAHVKECVTNKQLWTKLKSMFDDSGVTRRISLLRTLISIRLESCSSMVSYINQIVETSQRLRGTGFEITEEWVGSLLLAGLSDKYMPMVMAIEHSGISINTDVIKSKLLDMGGDTADNAGSAFYSRGRAGARTGGSSGSGGNGSKPQTSKKKTVKCYNQGYRNPARDTVSRSTRPFLSICRANNSF